MLANTNIDITIAVWPRPTHLVASLYAEAALAFTPGGVTIRLKFGWWGVFTSVFLGLAFALGFLGFQGPGLCLLSFSFPLSSSSNVTRY
jgi:hypothetical protein